MMIRNDGWNCLVLLSSLLLLLDVVTAVVDVSASSGGDGDIHSNENHNSNNHDPPHHGFDVEGKNPGIAYKYASSNPSGYFPTEWLRVPVIGIRDETHNSKIVTFGLPEGESLNLPVSSAILLHVPNPHPLGDDGDDVDDKNKQRKKKKPASIMRPYNPITSNDTLGSFSLLVKIYPDSKAGTYVANLSVGDAVAFKQTKGNVKKFRHPFVHPSAGDSIREITMVAGGTGIAPMVQALWPILREEGGPKVRLLYGNKGPEEIMLRKELDEMRSEHPDRLAVYYVVGKADDDDGGADGDASCRGGEADGDGTCGHGPAYERGWIDRDKIRRLGFPANDDGTSVVWICGVNEMYDSLAGSRAKPVKEGTVLYDLGFRDDTVWRS